ncbi:DUF6390 family protein [Nocardioides salsibiostraticola]
MSALGALRFARYAFPPNELGYCGPAGAREMLVPGAIREIEARARRFEGAWVYLEFLAEAFGDDDPLSEAVVEAYWIGTDALEDVASDVLVERLRERFVGQYGGTWQDASSRALAHHSFQVFEVYPWAGMLVAGLPPGPAVSVLDRCRVRTGTVTAVEGEWITATTRLLEWSGSALAPAPLGVERARWAVDGLGLMDAPTVGDVVALHWDWVCDVLTVEQATRIERLEERAREVVALSAP